MNAAMMNRSFAVVCGWLVAGAASLVLAGTAPSQENGSATNGKGTNGSKPAATKKRPRTSKAARAALSAAAAVLKKAKGKKGAERKTILDAAARAYEKVATDFAKEPSSAASGWFAAAEIRRKQSVLPEARGLYQKAMICDSGRYTERVTMQLAHIARRGKDAVGAAKLYAKVAAIQPKSSRAHQARIWIGRCHDGAGRPGDAIGAYKSAVAAAGTPRQVIDASNRLANALIKAKRLDDADSAIALAKKASTPVPDANGNVGQKQLEQLAKAFQKMSSRRALQRARDKANGASKDAKDVEKSRR